MAKTAVEQAPTVDTHVRGKDTQPLPVLVYPALNLASLFPHLLKFYPEMGQADDLLLRDSALAAAIPVPSEIHEEELRLRAKGFNPLAKLPSIPGRPREDSFTYLTVKYPLIDTLQELRAMEAGSRGLIYDRSLTQMDFGGTEFLEPTDEKKIEQVRVYLRAVNQALITTSDSINPGIYALELSGNTSKYREKVLAEAVEVFGPPLTQVQFERDPQHQNGILTIFVRKTEARLPIVKANPRNRPGRRIVSY